MGQVGMADERGEAMRGGVGSLWRWGIEDSRGLAEGQGRFSTDWVGRVSRQLIGHWLDSACEPLASQLELAQ